MYILMDSGHSRYDKNKNYRVSSIAIYRVGKNEKAGMTVAGVRVILETQQEVC